MARLPPYCNGFWVSSHGSLSSCTFPTKALLPTLLSCTHWPHRTHSLAHACLPAEQLPTFNLTALSSQRGLTEQDEGTHQWCIPCTRSLQVLHSTDISSDLHTHDHFPSTIHYGARSPEVHGISSSSAALTGHCWLSHQHMHFSPKERFSPFKVHPVLHGQHQLPELARAPTSP